jgi:cell division protein FtsZ
MSIGAHEHEHRPRIVVFGVGGAGGNAVNNMVAASLEGVEFVVANTDAQALTRARPEHRFQLGLTVTEGLGAGARPDIGRKAAEDSLPDIAQRVGRAHMVFVTAGMGGGTGTGAAPVIARTAREAGALVVGVVTKPFEFEGAKRMRIAEDGVRELEREVDTLIVIPNQNLFRIATEKTSIAEAFAMADEVLHSAVRGVTDLMTRPGVVNLDFADVRTVMAEMGKAVMGSGEAEGARRAADAVQAAIANPLLDDATLRGAKAALINVSGGPGLTLYEVDEAASAIRAEIDPDAEIIVGSAIDETLGERIRVSVVATGIPAGGAGAARARRAQASLSGARSASLSGSTSSSRARRERTASVAAGEAAEEKAGGPDFIYEPPIREARPRAFTPERRPAPEEPVAPAAAEDATASGIMDAIQARRAESLRARAGAAAPQKDEGPAVEAAPPEPVATDASDAAASEAERAEDEDNRAGRGGFSLFGRKRRKSSGEAVAAREPSPRVEDDDDLEIPAFLRRQAN